VKSAEADYGRTGAVFATVKAKAETYCCGCGVHEGVFNRAWMRQKAIGSIQAEFDPIVDCDITVTTLCSYLEAGRVSTVTGRGGRRA
jgi:hypothetical protein